MLKCFVIQPFDDDKFDKRFVDIFKPAIEKAELDPYRIDKDFSVRIPIEDIEENIKDSELCFAEITNDNPNVWYELGYAFACGKDVVMVCSDERQGKFPFDIQHRHVIKYKTSSKSDFESLEETITSKIKAYRSRKKTISSINTAPISDREGLKSHEIAIIVFTIENQISIEDSFSLYNLKNEMNKAGYTDVAVSVGIRTLKKSGLIETLTETNHYENHDFKSCRLTEKGEEWIMQNQDKLEFRIEQNINEIDSDDDHDDLPF